ncbi:type II toxin-antitoxin system ParD family antitoxin [Granulicella sibirica]|uniref:type II toxin-antitoxin system ParD family antitoxin n=1 Tax=Granulicella sibirica TaxID=2479048 RepID=UPI0010086966|nr:type II toxin-antitoxin system ParD family antitoxin [Granulicella sibirica]
MAAIYLPEDVQAVVDAEVRELKLSGAAEYVSRLIRQEQKRRAKEQLENLVIEGIESGDEVEMTAESWRELRLELHRQAGID